LWVVWKQEKLDFVIFDGFSDLALNLLQETQYV